MNCSALSAYLILGKLAASKCQKNKRTWKSKGSTFLNVPAHVRDEIITLDGIEWKNQSIKIKKASIQRLSKPHKATMRPGPIIILKTNTYLFVIF